MAGPVASSTQIADVMVTNLAALNLTYNGVAFPEPIRRKEPSLPQSANSPPTLGLVVSVGEEGLTEFFDFEYTVKVTYPCAVTIITNTGMQAGDDDQIRSLRFQIRQVLDNPAIYQTGAIPTFFALQSTEKAPFDKTALKSDLNYAVEVFGVICLESRTGQAPP